MKPGRVRDCFGIHTSACKAAPTGGPETISAMICLWRQLLGLRPRERPPPRARAASRATFVARGIRHKLSISSSANKRLVSRFASRKPFLRPFGARCLRGKLQPAARKPFEFACAKCRFPSSAEDPVTMIGSRTRVPDHTRLDDRGTQARAGPHPLPAKLTTTLSREYHLCIPSL